MRYIIVPLSLVLVLGGLFQRPVASSENAFTATKQVLNQYCFDCHGESGAEANVNLEAMVAAPEFSQRFKSWDLVVEMIREKRMPPQDMPQPSDAERQGAINEVEAAMARIARRDAGDPGRVKMRRLTNAEYSYTIRDLTGLELQFHSLLMGDAIGGEGFANVGDVQFIQDSTLERYLEAAKRVASHAIVAAGPIQFYEAPGKTGQELSAIRRIQRIYREHGFRSAAGEGGQPFGMDVYARAYFVAWQYRYRDQLGRSQASLEQLAREEGISIRFVQHIHHVLHHASSFPLTEIALVWEKLSEPTVGVVNADLLMEVRNDCNKLFQQQRGWQRRLSGTVSDSEEALLLNRGALSLNSKGELEVSLRWDEQDELTSVDFETVSATGQPQREALVIWQNAIIQFRQQEGPRPVAVPLSDYLIDTPDHQEEVGPWTTSLPCDVVRSFEFSIPDGTVGAQIRVQVELAQDADPNAIVRCVLKNATASRDTAADSGEASTIIGPSEGETFASWKSGVDQFAKALPDVSHREPAPSDRDPIPAPYDNSYNNAERNDFHYSIKYHRDDRFLVEHMLDDTTREALDVAWNDLLSSFDYHDTFLTFITDKAGRRAGREIAVTPVGELTPEVIDQMPFYGPMMSRLLQNHQQIENSLQQARENHVDQVLEVAAKAWRRPLTQQELTSLREFYEELQSTEEVDHDTAIRTLLTRILVAPEFLYRIETPASTDDIVELSQWDLASRLSYFLWASPPDRELWEAAAQQRLKDDGELARQTRRMLNDPRAERFAEQFFGQWFGFYRFSDYDGIDRKRFPNFDAELKDSMYNEAKLFFWHIVRNNRPVDEILFADYAFWNRRLAIHYGMSPEQIDENATDHRMVKDVSLLKRGGLLGLGVVHATTSAPLRTSAVKRGDWILRRVLDTHVPPPPDDAGSIPADDSINDGLTIRERLMAHRQDAACINCHTRMDPLGFALENFDPTGRWREQYRDGQQIDASGQLSDGSEIDGFAGLQSHLRAERPRFHRTLSAKLLGYALGRRQLLSDQQLIDEMLEDIGNGAGLSDLAVRIVKSSQFRTMRSTADAGP